MEAIGKAHTAERKQIHLDVMLSEAEHDKLMRLCQKSGLTLSAFIRHLIRETEIRPRPDADFLSLYNVIRSLECDLNLLIRKAGPGPLSEAALHKAIACFQSVSIEIESWKKQWL